MNIEADNPDLTGAIEALPKAIVYMAVLVAVGACAAHRLRRVLRPRGSDGSPWEVEPTFVPALLPASVVLVVALLLRALAHSVAAFGSSDALGWENLRVIVLESAWSAGWRLQVALAVALVGAAAIARRAPRRGWILGSVLAVAICYAIPLLGHAAGEPVRVFVHGSHVLGAGIWLGSLAVLRLEGPAAGRGDDLSRFAPIATTGALVVGMSGALAAWSYLTSIADLWAGVYGRLLLAKLAVVAGVALCGLANWRRYRSVASGERAAPRSLALVTTELLLAALVVVITAVLTEMPHP